MHLLAQDQHRRKLRPASIYTTPNTLFGLIPLGADTKTIPLRNVASVDTSTKFNLGSPVWGVVFLAHRTRDAFDSSVACRARS